MLRRSPNSATPLHRKQEELSRLESELQNEVARLERVIAEAPRVAQETSRRQREELLRRANEGGSRLDASVALRDKRYGDDDQGSRRGRHRSLRKARREGRIVFLVLVIALAAAVIWLASHLRF
jgi:hypothetical protein